MNVLFVHIISFSWGNMDISKLFFFLRGIAGFKVFATFSPTKSYFFF